MLREILKYFFSLWTPDPKNLPICDHIDIFCDHKNAIINLQDLD